MTREEIIAAVQECAAKLGRAPNTTEFQQMTGISKHQVRKNFRTYMQLLAASGEEKRGPGYAVAMEAMFKDWACVARKLGKIPTVKDYHREGGYSVRPFIRRYGAWGNVPQGLMAYAMKYGPEGEWEDVLKILGEHLRIQHGGDKTYTPVWSEAIRKERLPGRAVYGRPMFGALSFTPANEQGVLLLLGAVAPELGLFITRVQTQFPDVEALREISPHLCQKTYWELEYESRNFLEHMHPLKADGCDGIICWINNWPDCPLEVIELRSVVERLARQSGDRT